MCGIFGIISEKERDIGKDLLEGGRRLSYRGYDSVGCTTISASSEIDLRKNVGTVEEVSKELNFAEMTGNRGLLQLRWATFGAPSKVNAQPHIDSNGDLVGAHNGNIVNTVQLREQYLKEGLKVRSTNDGEICIHAISRHFHKGKNMLESILEAYRELKGDYAFIIFDKDENKLYAIKKGSGLYIGIGKGEMYCSSDLPSLLPLTRKIVTLKDGEIISMDNTSYKIFSAENGEEIQREPIEVKESMDVAKKEGYDHFMLKEIHEQPLVAHDLLDLLESSEYVDPFLEKIKNSKQLFLVGSGSSYNACVIGSYYFNNIAKKIAVPVYPQQLIEQYNENIDEDTAIIFVSQSGETKDVLNAVKHAKKHRAKILGVLNVIGSTLMHESENYLPLACGYEISVPATKTFINQVVMFYYLAKKLGGEDTAELFKLPGLLQKTIELTDKRAQEVVSHIKDWNDLYYLGYGATYGVALEGALKLKEITYSHCEGMFSSEFKHGPLSAVEKDYPVFFIAAPNDSYMLVSHINEVVCREGKAVAVSEDDESLIKNASLHLEVPKSDQYTSAILLTIPLQLVAYYASVRKGINPDFPRNLSKTLTVD